MTTIPCKVARLVTFKQHFNKNNLKIAAGTFPIADDEISGPFYEVAKILSVEMNFVPRIRYFYYKGILQVHKVSCP